MAAAPIARSLASHLLAAWTLPANDPDEAVAWDDAAHTIATYRHRNDIHDDANPLGRQPRGASARAERARAQRRVEDAQRRLGRTVDRSAQHMLSR
jgi:hypothetical protein